MSKSRKKPFYKDNGLYNTHEYWSVIRHEWKQKLNEEFRMNTPFGLYWETFDVDDTFDLRNPKVIINDYDYCDYIWHVSARDIADEWINEEDYRGWYGTTKREIEIYSRK